jgi:uncharacterized protein YneF (UPF0154 family)
MRKVSITLGIICIVLFVAGGFFVNSFGMILIGIALVIGIVLGVIQRIRRIKRMFPDKP